MKNKILTRRNQRGLTFIELLIAMVIGVFIIGGISQVFMNNKRSSGLLMAETELQENARFAFSIITKAVQNAGSLGCKSSTTNDVNSLLDFDDSSFRPWLAIEGWEARNTQYGDIYRAVVSEQTIRTPDDHWLTSKGAVLDSDIDAVRNSDILKVWHVSGESAALKTINENEMTFEPIDIEQGDVIVLNDCKTITLAQVCNCDLSEGTPCADMDERADISPSSCQTPGNKPFAPKGLNMNIAEVQVLEESVFFIGKRDQDQSVTSSLFRRTLGKDGKLGEREEVLEGLESMQLHYGEDTNGDKSPNYYVSADKVTDWQKVISVRISLLMRSFKDRLLQTSQTINFNGAKVVLNEKDSYLRRVYTTTVALRNRNIEH